MRYIWILLNTAFWTAVLGSLGIFISIFESKKGKFLGKCARIWAKIILFCGGVKYTVKNLDNLNLSNSYIFASNHSSGLIKENSKGIPHFLIPYIIKVAVKELPILKVFGKDYKTKDGTCIRDFIHVMDLADGHISMIKNNRLKKGLKVYNFGTGKGLSVLEIVKVFEKQTGIPISFRFEKRRKGDVAASFCSSKKAFKELNWKIKYDLNQAMVDIKKIIYKKS